MQNNTFPKLIALDTNWLLWWGAMSEDSWGQGKDATAQVEDNIELVNDLKLRDKSDPVNYVYAREELSAIVAHVVEEGAKVAIIARQPNKEMCQKSLSFLKIADFITYIEVDESRVATFRRLKEWSGFDYSDMLFYSAEADSNEVRIHLGIPCIISLDDQGLNWDLYQRGVDHWRRVKLIEVPKDITKTKPVCIGYSGITRRKLQLLRKGEYEVDPTAIQRWGYGVYCTDDLSIAQFHGDWKEKNYKKKAFICAVYVWDFSVFIEQVKKIWVPGNARKFQHTENDRLSREEGARRFEQKQRFVETHWGVSSTYILFSRHPWTERMSTPRGQRYNELVIGTEIFRSLCYIEPIPDDNRQDCGHLQYNLQAKNWKIEMPKETQYDFKVHEEYYE